MELKDKEIALLKDELNNANLQIAELKREHSSKSKANHGGIPHCQVNSLSLRNSFVPTPKATKEKGLRFSRTAL